MLYFSGKGGGKMKKIAASFLCFLILLTFAGCGGAATQNSESEDFKKAKESFNEYLSNANYIEYEFNGKKIFNVMVDSNDLVDSDAVGIGEMMANLAATGKVGYDFFYIDVIQGSGQRVGSLVFSATGEFWQAMYEKEESQPTSSPSSEEGQQGAAEAVFILDQDGVKVSAIGTETDGLGFSVLLSIENNSGRNITVQSRDSSVNGYMVDAILSQDVMDGKKANCDMTFMSSRLEDAGVEEIEEVEFALIVLETDSFDTIFESDAIKLEY